MPDSLYLKVKRSVAFAVDNSSEETNRFIQDLPFKLKVEISQLIFENHYKHLKFFKDGKHSSSFIAWICPLLQPRYVEADC